MRVSTALVSSLLVVRLADETVAFLPFGAFERFRADLGLTYAQAASVLVLFPAAGLFGAVFGVAADHVSRRALAAAGAAGYGLGLIGFATGHNYAALAVSATAMGIAGDAMVRATEVALTDLAADDLDRALARQNLLGTIGDFCGPLLLAGSLALGWGWRPAVAAGGVGLLAYAALLASVAFPGPLPDGERPRPLAGVLTAVRDPRVWALGAVMALADLFDEPFFAFVIAALDQERGVSPAAATLVAVAATVGALGGAVVGERLRPSQVVSASVLAAGVAGIAAAPSVAVAAIPAAVVGAAAMALWIRTQASVLGLRVGQAGTTMSVVSSIAVVGTAFPLLVGGVSDAHGLMAGLATYVAAAALLVVACRRGQRFERAPIHAPRANARQTWFHARGVGWRALDARLPRGPGHRYPRADMGRGAAAVLGVVVLAIATLQLSDATSTEAHEGNYPVVLIPGWHGDPTTFDTLVADLEAQGLAVLDFDPGLPGAQAMRYGPTGSGQHISFLAGLVVEEEIERALVRNGYDADSPIDVVAHSMGGLLARFLIEHPGADVDAWSDAGWSGDGVPDVADDWAARIDDLVMLGTPHHGTWEAWVPGKLGGFGDRNASGGDMQPGSTFLRHLRSAAPPGEHYTCIGGDPWYLPGFDGVVPTASSFVAGCDSSTVGSHHGELLTAAAPLALVGHALGYTSIVDRQIPANLVGTATVRLERAAVARDHDWGTDDDLRFEFWVDDDGNNDGYELVDTLSDRRDAPFSKDWGDDGPSTAAVPLPGTSPRIDVKLVVWEDDWFWGREPVSTVYFTDLMLSDDLDGMAYYEASAPDADGGIDTFRISLNGVSSRGARGS